MAAQRRKQQLRQRCASHTAAVKTSALTASMVVSVKMEQNVVLINVFAIRTVETVTQIDVITAVSKIVIVKTCT